MSLLSTFSSASVNGYQSPREGYNLQVLSGAGYQGSAVSGDGNYIVVIRASIATNADIYYYTNGSYELQQTITVAAGLRIQPIWGVSLNYDGSYIAIGENNNAAGTTASQVTIYNRSGATWSLQATLLPSDTPQYDFGYSVDLNYNGDVLIVGNPERDLVNGYGSCYIFDRTGTSWSETTKFSQTDLETKDYFGSAVSINGNGDVAVIGAPSVYSTTGRTGKVYTFEDTGTWSQQQKLTNTTTARNWGTYVNISNNNSTLSTTGTKYNPLATGALSIYDYTTVWTLRNSFLNSYSSTYPYGDGTGIANDGSNIYTSGIDETTTDKPVIFEYNTSLINTYVPSTYTGTPTITQTSFAGNDSTGNVLLQTLIKSGDWDIVIYRNQAY